MNNKIMKFENPVRLKELNPKETLVKAGFKENMILCDIGAGTGIFSIPAALISGEKTYALEISTEMISILENKKTENNVPNLEIKKVDSEILPIEDKACDFALMVTVFHEIDDKPTMLKEITRLLKPEGSLMIIEFHKKESPMGPPLEHRVSEQEVIEICLDNGFVKENSFYLGENFYSLIFKKN